MKQAIAQERYFLIPVRDTFGSWNAFTSTRRESTTSRKEVVLDFITSSILLHEILTFILA